MGMAATSRTLPKFLQLSQTEFVFLRMSIHDSADRSEPYDFNHRFYDSYDRLRSMAQEVLRHNRDHSQPATALVHSVWVRLQSNPPRDEQAFKACAMLAIRSVLVDHHRRRTADKRGGQFARINADADDLPDDPMFDPAMMIDLMDAMNALAADEPHLSAIINLHLDGHKQNDIARRLGVSPASISRHLPMAMSYLANRLKSKQP